MENIFKYKESFGEYLRNNYILLIVFVGALISIPILFLIHGVVTLLLGFLSIIVAFFLLVILILNRFMPWEPIKISDSMMQIPCSGQKGYYFKEFDSHSGYKWEISRKMLIISSDLKNIEDLYIVTDVKEKESIKTNRGLYDLNVEVKMGPVSARAKEIPALIQSLKEGNYEPYRKVLLEAFRYNYAYNPEKTVAIKFKKLSYYLPALLRGKITDQIESYYNKNFPVFQHQVVYISVSNPEELISMLKAKIRNGKKQ